MVRIVLVCAEKQELHTAQTSKEYVFINIFKHMIGRALRNNTIQYACKSFVPQKTVLVCSLIVRIILQKCPTRQACDAGRCTTISFGTCQAGTESHSSGGHEPDIHIEARIATPRNQL